MHRTIFFPCWQIAWRPPRPASPRVHLMHRVLGFPWSQRLPPPHTMHLVLRFPCWQIAWRLPSLVYPCLHSMHRVLCFPCSQMLPAPHWMHLVLRCPCWQIASRLPRLVYPCAHSMHRVHCFPCSQTSRRLPRFLTALTPFGLPMPSRPLHPFIVAIVPRSPQTFRRRVVHSWRGAWAERRIRAMRTEQRDEAEGRCFDVVAVATAPPFVPGPCCVAHPSCGTAWKTRIFMQRKDRATGSKYRRERYARGFPQVCGQLDTSLYWCASIAR